MLARATHNDQVSDDLESERQGPRDRIRSEKPLQIMKIRDWENEIDPNEAQAAHPDHRDNHWHKRRTDAAHDACKDLHIAAKEVSGGEHGQAQNGVLNNLFIATEVKIKHLTAEKDLDTAEDRPNERDKKKRTGKDLFDAVKLARADVLPDECKRAVIHRILCGIDEPV